LYVGDAGNHVVRSLALADGTVGTWAGANSVGAADGQGNAARFDGPQAVAGAPDGMLYVADTNNHTLRRVTPAGVVSTFAGAARVGGADDGPGAAARFYHPAGLALADGQLYVADSGNARLRKVDLASGVVSSLAVDFAGVVPSFRPAGLSVAGGRL